MFPFDNEDQGEQLHKRIRLKEKTDPSQALGYPQRPLLKKADYKLRKAKLKKEQLAQTSLPKKQGPEPCN